ncbi:MAG: dihydropteroate synthase [Candidatus Margulisbacteria bacterium]|jgi:dihydropteroate synthase|nr:dihydropteroate synthase [Candidatus Margulisiibacteriota bacterium]
MLYPLTLCGAPDLYSEMLRIGCSPQGARYMQDKLSALTLKITDLTGTCAIVLKEEALSAGAECALPRETILKPRQKYAVLLLATRRQLQKIRTKLKSQLFGELRALAENLKTYCAEPRPPRPPVIMGILNVTPDSFSDGGRYAAPAQAVAHGLALLRAGAQIIDIGGETTKPGAPEISAREELRRTIPVIKALRARKPRAVISIDTTKKAVALAAVQAGAQIINDVSGLTGDPELAGIAARHQARLILMHRTGASKVMQRKTRYAELLTDILQFLARSVSTAQNYGMPLQNIIVDPGIGFGKTPEQNLYLLKNLQAFRSLGCAVLLGASRKSVIGQTLQKPVEQRLAGTIATSLAGVLGQVDYLRVHDAAENLDAVKMFCAIRQSKNKD